MKKTIKFFTIALTFLLASLAVLPHSALAAGPSLSLSPASQTLGSGCKATISVNIQAAGSQVTGVDAIVIYDPTRFVVNRINKGTIFDNYPTANIDTKNGKIYISGVVSPSGQPFTGNGTLATFDVTTVSGAPAGVTQMKFEFDPTNKANTTDSNIADKNSTADVLDSVYDGSYTLTADTACPSDSNTQILTKPTYSPVGGLDVKQPVPTKVLNDTADATTTILVASVGGILTLLGIIGLALL